MQPELSAIDLFAGPGGWYVLPEDRDRLPWVSMAEALGWHPEDELEYQRGEGMKERHGDRPGRAGSEPGTGGVGTSMKRKFRNDNRANACERDLTEPAPSLHFGARSNKVDWVSERPAPTIVTTRRSKDGILVGRQLPEGEGENVGGHGWEDGESQPESSGEAIRVSLEEALVLQSFPPDYPVQGTKSQRYLQVGNAVPPLLAKAILTQLLKPVLDLESSMKEGVV